MKKFCCFSTTFLLLTWAVIGGAAQAEESYTRREDVIYGRKFGTALTI